RAHGSDAAQGYSILDRAAVHRASGRKLAPRPQDWAGTREAGAGRGWGPHRELNRPGCRRSRLHPAGPCGILLADSGGRDPPRSSRSLLEEWVSTHSFALVWEIGRVVIAEGRR